MKVKSLTYTFWESFWHKKKFSFEKLSEELSRQHLLILTMCQILLLNAFTHMHSHMHHSHVPQRYGATVIPFYRRKKPKHRDVR